MGRLGTEAVEQQREVSTTGIGGAGAVDLGVPAVGGEQLAGCPG
jgi:hypothetical protein